MFIGGYYVYGYGYPCGYIGGGMPGGMFILIGFGGGIPPAFDIGVPGTGFEELDTDCDCYYCICGYFYGCPCPCYGYYY